MRNLVKIMSKLFGTDGIRGRAGEFPLDNDTVRIIGYSLAKNLGLGIENGLRLVIGRDTRWSGSDIEQALFDGAAAAGATCESAGVITTPGVAYLTVHSGFDAGIVISASHNPCDDNGLKVFLPSGEKLDRSIEEKIEADVAEGLIHPQSSDAHFDVSNEARYQREYLEHFKHDFGGLKLDGLKIVADCANGAVSDLGPRLFESYGAKVIAINNTPDGKNINKDCGSLHLEGLQQKVVAEDADFGVGFDGDADRSLFVDEKGEIVDGDATLWVMANLLAEKSKLKDNTVVATVMSNIGLERALESKGIKLLRTSVGDKYVLKALLDGDFSVGGEQSGHIIFPRRSLVGDGMQTALYMLEAMVESDMSLSALTHGFVKYPQILVNKPVSQKKPFEEVPADHGGVQENRKRTW